MCVDNGAVAERERERERSGCGAPGWEGQKELRSSVRLASNKKEEEQRSVHV